MDNKIIESIEKLAAIVKSNNLHSISYQVKDMTIVVEGQNPPKQIVAAPAYAAQSVVPPAAGVAAPATATPPAAPAAAGNIVKAPIVGTFYSSPSPDKPAFVNVGSKIKKGDILFIIESMKVMNEIASEFDGTVAEIFIKSGNPVEYDQAVLRVE